MLQSPVSNEAHEDPGEYFSCCLIIAIFMISIPYFRNRVQPPRVIGKINLAAVEKLIAFFNIEIHDIILQERNKPLHSQMLIHCYKCLLPLEDSFCFQEFCKPLDTLFFAKPTKLIWNLLSIII